MSHETISSFFDAIAGRYERAYALQNAQSRERMERVVRALPPAPARVLDLGVGTGREITTLLDAGYTPTGVDVSKAMLERCARRARPVRLIEADFWRPLPFPESSFDAVVALHGTLAHPPDDGAITRLALALAEIVRRNGAWIAEVPTPAWLDSLEKLPWPDDRRAQRTGPQTFVFEDRIVGASVAGRVLSDAQWRAALGNQWKTRVEPMDNLEWFIVAVRV